MGRIKFWYGYLLVLTVIVMLTVWRVVSYESQIFPRAAVLRIGEYLIPLPMGTQVIINGGQMHCYLIFKEFKEQSSDRAFIGLAYAKGNPEDLVRNRKSSGWTAQSSLQEDSALTLTHLMVQRVILAKPGRRLGYYFIRARDEEPHGILLIEWLCREDQCEKIEESLRQWLKQIEVDSNKKRLR